MTRMFTRTLPALAFALSAVLAAAAESRALTVVLPTVPFIEGGATRQTAMAVCLSRHLRERLGECAGVRLVSEGRAGRIIAELTSARRQRPADTELLGAFSAFLPVDAFIEYRIGQGDEELQLAVHTRAGVKRHQVGFALKSKITIQQAVLRAAEIIGQDLALGMAEVQALKDARNVRPEVFEAVHVSMRTTAQWPMNAGEVRYLLLRPILGKNPENPRMQAAICDAVKQLLQGAKRRPSEHLDRAVGVAKVNLPKLLGTPYEPDLHELVMANPNAFQPVLLELAEGIAGSGIDEKLMDIDPGADLLGGMEGATPKVPGSTAEAPRERRLGAVRLLGLVGGKAAGLLKTAAGHADREVRQAAAYALGLSSDKKTALPLLQKLARDKDADVALVAMHALAVRQGEKPDALPAKIREVAATQAAEAAKDGKFAYPNFRLAVELLARHGGAGDRQIFISLCADRRDWVRQAAADTLARTGGAELPLVRQLLQDVNEETVVSALAMLPQQLDAPMLGEIIALANDPAAEVARTARRALQPHRPRDTREALLFDLQIEHDYIRKNIVSQMAALQPPWSIQDLEGALANRGPQVREHALRLLCQADAERGRRAAAAALADPYFRVRLRAAALLAEMADAQCRDQIAAALAKEKDAVLKLYLEDALAKAEGRPLAPPPPAAKQVKDQPATTWLFGSGQDIENSPFTAYYMGVGSLNEAGRRAADAGKIVFCRPTPTGNPGTIIINPAAADSYWLTLRSQVPATDAPYLDGFVFGEETMSMKLDALWEEGWPLFCRDAGIDLEKVGGDQKKLGRYEKRAWDDWAANRWVDGFNEMYDFAKLYHGKVRPGIQICTFMPEQGGPNPADRRWKFDVGGIYDYKGDQRLAAYALVRRYKTLWPERPVLWFSLGIGGYEMNPVRRTDKVPSGPMLSRSTRAWADAVSAYIAGAEMGWFSVWIFVEKNFRGAMKDLRGAIVSVEDVVPGSKTLANAVEYSFKGAERDHDEKPPVAVPQGGLEEELDDFQLEDASVRQNQVKEVIGEDKDAFLRGFLFYGRHVYDCARVFLSLPRQQPKPAALVVRPGVNVWTRPNANPLIPAEALLNQYDHLNDINKTAELDLSRYRLIIVHNPGALRDATIVALSAWLREQPGILYVHQHLSANNADQAATVADFSGTLKNDWPWEQDVQTRAPKKIDSRKKLPALELTAADGRQLKVASGLFENTVTVAAKTASVIFASGDNPALAVWRRDDFKGAVVFDAVETASIEYLQALRRELNALREKHGVGLLLDGPALLQVLNADGLVAAASTSYFGKNKEAVSYPGVDLFSCLPGQKVGESRGAVITAEKLQGRFSAAMNGVAVLADAPLSMSETAPGGMRVQSAGLIRAGAATGTVKLKAEDGIELPEITENRTDWLHAGTTPGMATVKQGENKSVVFFRCPRPVVVTAGE